MKRAKALGVFPDVLNVLAVNGFKVFLGLVMNAVMHCDIAAAYSATRHGQYRCPSWEPRSLLG